MSRKSFQRDLDMLDAMGLAWRLQRHYYRVGDAGLAKLFSDEQRWLSDIYVEMMLDPAITQLKLQGGR